MLEESLAEIAALKSASSHPVHDSRVVAGKRVPLSSSFAELVVSLRERKQGSVRFIQVHESLIEHALHILEVCRLFKQL